MQRRSLLTIAGIAVPSLALGVGALIERAPATGSSIGQGLANATGTGGSATLRHPLSAVLETQQWLNSQPLEEADLLGKVVLVNFWTYSCINSLRTLPYLRNWATKYRDRGLVVIGAHSPEFRFERDLRNVREASASLGVGYPIAIDNGFQLWRAFENEAWPGFYFFDARGHLRHHAFGEGDYEHSERLIQRLLAENDGAETAGEVEAITGSGAQEAPDWANLRSPETYFGYAQARDFASPGSIRRDMPNVYRAATRLNRNHWSLEGDWTIGAEFASLNEAAGAIAYRFHARDLHLVLAPSESGRSVRFRASIDGRAPGADRGSDVNADGLGVVQEPRMYQLIRQAGSIADREFQIEFLDAGVRAYAVTFG